MPCLNEAQTLESCIRKAIAFLDRSEIRGEIIIGDNGSTDGSQQIAARLGARVVNVEARGYGAALDGATRAARGKYVIVGDSDDSYDFANLDPFVAKLRQGYDLVMGNRFLGGVHPGAMPWKNRYLGNPLLTAIGRLFFKCPARDFHCGLRGYSLQAYRRMDLQTTGMEFASEMVIKATLLGMRIAEVPTTLSPDGRSRPPHLRPWRDGWRHLRFMLLYSPRWLFLIPGTLLIVIASIAFTRLLFGPLIIGKVTFDVHTLLYVAAGILIGFQAVLFAVFTKIFAITEGLMPRARRLEKLFQYITLEVGLVVGLVLVVGGIAGTLVAVTRWGAWHSFGKLDPQRMLRAVVPSVLALALGFQVIFASFFLSVLGLRTRRRRMGSQEEISREQR